MMVENGSRLFFCVFWIEVRGRTNIVCQMMANFTYKTEPNVRLALYGLVGIQSKDDCVLCYIIILHFLTGWTGREQLNEECPFSEGSRRNAWAPCHPCPDCS